MTRDELHARALEACKEEFMFIKCAQANESDPWTSAIAAYEAALWCDDMDAAPRDGTPILAHDGERWFECWFEGGEFVRSLIYDEGFVVCDDEIKRWRYPPTPGAPK